MKKSTTTLVRAKSIDRRPGSKYSLGLAKKFLVRPRKSSAASDISSHKDGTIVNFNQQIPYGQFQKYDDRDLLCIAYDKYIYIWDFTAARNLKDGSPIAELLCRINRPKQYAKEDVSEIVLHKDKNWSNVALILSKFKCILFNLNVPENYVIVDESVSNYKLTNIGKSSNPEICNFYSISPSAFKTIGGDHKIKSINLPHSGLSVLGGIWYINVSRHNDGHLIQLTELESQSAILGNFLRSVRREISYGVRKYRKQSSDIGLSLENELYYVSLYDINDLSHICSFALDTKPTFISVSPSGLKLLICPKDIMDSFLLLDLTLIYQGTINIISEFTIRAGVAGVAYTNESSIAVRWYDERTFATITDTGNIYIIHNNRCIGSLKGNDIMFLDIDKTRGKLYFILYGPEENSVYRGKVDLDQKDVVLEKHWTLTGLDASSPEFEDLLPSQYTVLSKNNQGVVSEYLLKNMETMTTSSSSHPKLLSLQSSTSWRPISKSPNVSTFQYHRQMLENEKKRPINVRSKNLSSGGSSDETKLLSISSKTIPFGLPLGKEFQKIERMGMTNYTTTSSTAENSTSNSSSCNKNSSDSKKNEESTINKVRVLKSDVFGTDDIDPDRALETGTLVATQVTDAMNEALDSASLERIDSI